MVAIAYDLSRFIEAQQRDYAIALAEIRAARKQSHWMWYIFPQLKGFGRSSTSEYYGIDGRGSGARRWRRPGRRCVCAGFWPGRPKGSFQRG